MQLKAALQHALEATTSARLCACGTPIEPVKTEGFPDFYPRQCATCEVIRTRVEEAIREEQTRRGQGIPPLYLGSTFDNLREPRPSRQIISTCRAFAVMPNRGRGLYLWSKTNGNGKSHLAAAIVIKGGGFFVNTIDLFDAIKDTFGSSERCRLFEHALSANLLVLDDFGSQQPGEWAEGRLYRLINLRTTHLLPTVFTSNYSPDEIEERVGARIASRILGSCGIVHVDGPDHRRLARRDLI